MSTPEFRNFPGRSPAQQHSFPARFFQSRIASALEAGVAFALAAAIPDLVHHQMKVGMAYFHWQ